MKIETTFTKQLNIEFPIIMAPMFLVSNEAMILSAMRNGIAGVFPSLNYRKENELSELLKRLNAFNNNCKGTYGVNLIVQKQIRYMKNIFQYVWIIRFRFILLHLEILNM